MLARPFADSPLLPGASAIISLVFHAKRGHAVRGDIRCMGEKMGCVREEKEARGGAFIMVLFRLEGQGTRIVGSEARSSCFGGAPFANL